jgi:hypothetical protein
MVNLNRKAILLKQYLSNNSCSSILLWVELDKTYSIKDRYHLYFSFISLTKNDLQILANKITKFSKTKRVLNQNNHSTSKWIRKQYSYSVKEMYSCVISLQITFLRQHTMQLVQHKYVLENFDLLLNGCFTSVRHNSSRGKKYFASSV